MCGASLVAIEVGGGFVWFVWFGEGSNVHAGAE